MDSSPGGNKRINVLVGVDYYYSCTGSEIKRGSGNQPLAISSIFDWILCGCNETQGKVHTNLNSTDVLHLNSKNVINDCFDKEPFELDFSKVFTRKIVTVQPYIERIPIKKKSNKINEIKDDVILVLKKTLLSEIIVIKLNFHLRNTVKLFRTTYQKFD